MTRSSPAIISLAALSIALAAPAVAQTAPARSSVHGEEGADIVVTANYLRDLDIVAGQSVLTGDQLARQVRGQIGDTLTQLPGVSATSFTPGASRPVLRGFQGERIRVLTDGLGSLDVSNTSADHGVAIDPLTAERIEVLRGPAVLLFGSQAIGGAVNVLDRRIPRVVPENPIHIDAIAGYGTAAHDRSAGASLDFALTPHIVGHVDGSWRKSGDLRTGGHVLSPALRTEQREIAQEELDEGHDDEAAEALGLANLRGKVPNSGVRTYTLGGGLSLINEGGSLGFSVGYYDSDYGVPARPGSSHHHGEEGGEEEEHGHEEGPVTIGMKQWRADMRGEIEVGGGFLDRIRTRIGYADYQHIEYEGAEVGTTFLSDAIEGRLELVQADRDGWRGVTGFQGYTRDFRAIGEEAFVAPNQTDQYGLFTLQEFALGKWGLEAAARYERTNVSSGAVKLGLGPAAPEVAVSRKFDAFSGAVGISYALAPELKLGLTGSRAVRAPSAEELFANGLHVATQAYELGDPGFSSEKSWGLEAYLRGRTGPLRFSLSTYAQWFDDYIYEVATGMEDTESELPIYAFRQADARYLGFEGEVEAALVEQGDFGLTGRLVADYVHAQIGDGGGAVPRIPPLRILAGLEGHRGDFGAQVEVEHMFDQDRVAVFETPTDGFTMVNLSASWHPWGRDRETSLILSANNLFDTEARRHASFTKDFVPLSGRDIRLSARFSF